MTGHDCSREALAASVWGMRTVACGRCQGHREVPLSLGERPGVQVSHRPSGEQGSTHQASWAREALPLGFTRPRPPLPGAALGSHLWLADQKGCGCQPEMLTRGRPTLIPPYPPAPLRIGDGPLRAWTLKTAQRPPKPRALHGSLTSAPEPLSCPFLGSPESC